MRNSVNHKIFRAKETYFKNAFCENKGNPKKTWNIINELTSKNRKTAQITEINLNGHLINDSNKIADAFNEYFSNIGSKLADNIDFNEGNRSYHEYLSGQNTNTTFQLKETNSLTVSLLLSKLSRSKATGLDKISTRLLQECPDLIAEHLSLIFNRSIITGIFPNEWKCAKVVTIHNFYFKNFPHVQ